MRLNITAVKMAQKLLVLAACVALGAAQQTTDPPVYKEKHIFLANHKFSIDCNTRTELGKNVKYEWKKDGTIIPSKSDKGVIDNRGSLQFPNPDTSTEGVYECLAKSDLGVASSGPISLKRAYINKPQQIETQKHSPVKGAPFELSCPQVDAYPKPEITWMVKEKSQPSPKPFLNVRTTIGPNGYLYFANVTDEDASKDMKYICATQHPASKDSVVLAEHVIQDLKEAKPVTNKAVLQYLSTDIVAKEGDQIFLYCIYGGAIPPPDYFFEGKNVNGDEKPETQRVTRHNRSKGRRLLIKSVMRSDQGTYTCKISEADGTVTEKSMKLTVVSAPKIVKTPELKTVAKQGNDVTLPCQFLGFPTPKITWTYNAKPLPAGGRITVSSANKPGVEGSTSDLTIKGVQKSDAGYYGCIASNNNGTIYVETLLSIA